MNRKELSDRIDEQMFNAENYQATGNIGYDTRALIQVLCMLTWAIIYTIQLSMEEKE